MKLKIGLELHIQIDIETKLFSVSKNDVHSKFNTNVNRVDVGTPGSMPSLNKKAVELGIRLAFLLNSKFVDKLFFDRKNYFYHDLPKGYQITQKFKPLATGGSFSFLLENNEFKTVNISSIILEEDTANSKIEEKYLYVDYNRSGIALIELVTEPDFNSAEEVKNFLEAIIRTLKRAKISKCKFSDGNIRVDINVSVFSEDLKSTNRVEIKNLNKLENIVKSINQEFKIQKEYLEKEIFNFSVTKKFDESLKKIVEIRKKMTEEDYLFIPETNILPIKIPKKIIDNEKKFIEENKFLLEKEIIEKFKLNFKSKNILLKNECFFKLFLDIYPKKLKDKEKIINFFESTSFLFDNKKCFDFEIIFKILNNNLNNKEIIDITKKIILNREFNIKKYLEEKKQFQNFYSEK